MPTGYTADVGDGKLADFATFALRCARAFGATVMQRDNPLDEPPKLRVASTHEAEQVAKYAKRIEELEGMTLRERAKAAKRAHSERVQQARRLRDESDTKRERYEAMLAEVRRWTPPSKEHRGLKDFMIQQLTESIKFDCHDWPDPEEKSPDEWWTTELSEARRMRSHYVKYAADEEERVEQANRWTTALYESLGASV